MDPKLAVYSELLPKKAGKKGKTTYLSIIEAALRCYSKHGVDNTTFEKLAAETDVTRPLIIRYFKDYNGVFEACVKYTRIHYQQWVIGGILEEKDPKRHFQVYVERALSWTHKFPAHGQLWAFFYYQCARTKRYRSLNTELANMGEKRIEALLGGSESHSGLVPSDLRAKFVQAIIAGVISVSATEEPSPKIERLEKDLSALLLRL